MGEPALVIPFPEPGTFEDAWKALPATMKARSDKKATCDALWRREAKRLGGERMLLLRLTTYLRDSPDLKRTGGPGLQVLLRSGTLEHWTPMQDAPLAPDDTKFPHQEIRRTLAKQEGEGWVRSYLDPCVIDGTTLIVRTGMAVDKLKAHGALFKAHGFSGMRKK